MSLALIAGVLGLGLLLGGGGGSKPSSPSQGWGWADDHDTPPYEPEGPNVPEEIDVSCMGIENTGGETDGLNYVEIITGGASRNDTLPMVVALHGLGQTKEYLVNKLDSLNIPARVIIPDAFYDRGDKPGRNWWRGWNPAGLQAFMAEAIPETALKIAPLVARLPYCRPTQGLPLVVGHSQGGYIALEFAVSFPHLVSGVVSSAAWRPVAIWDDEPTAPVIAVHGRNDTGVPYNRSLEYYEEMIARGLPFEHRSTNGSHSLGTSNLNAFQGAIVDSLSRAGYAGARSSFRPRRRFR